MEKDCWKKQSKERASVSNDGDWEVVLMTQESDFIMSAVEMDNLWIGDTGASCHLVKKEDGLINVRKISKKIKFGDGSSLTATKVGDLPVIVKQKNGKKFKATLEDVKVVPNMICNLFSIVSCLRKGWNIGNDGKVIKLSKGKTQIKFDQELATKTGYLAGVKLIPCIGEVTNLESKDVNVNILHQRLGHCC